MSELTGFSKRPAWVSIILILLTATLGFTIIGPLVGVLVSLPFYEGSIIDLATNLGDPIAHPEVRLPLIITQGCATLVGLILIPYLYLLGIENTRAIDWVKGKSVPLIIVGITTLMVISFMATNSIVIEWNANVAFPDFMKEFGEWARETEKRAEELTKFFTTFTSFGDFLVGIFVIAFLPAIGEELVFRGMLQSEINRLTGNQHIAIWVAAIIFSAFHIQFFGFVPRMLLGALFGYLYVWSGNLIIPMIAHFVNNGFSVLMMYLYQIGVITTDLESPEAAPWPAVVAFTFIFGFLLLYFKKYYATHNLQPE